MFAQRKTTTEADPVDLIRAARKGLGQGYLIVAGSVGSAARIRDVKQAGAKQGRKGHAQHAHGGHHQMESDATVPLRLMPCH